MKKQMEIQMRILTILVAVLPVQVKERKVKITECSYCYCHYIYFGSHFSMFKFLKKELKDFFSALRDADPREMGGVWVVSWAFDFFASSVTFNCHMPLPPSLIA